MIALQVWVFHLALWVGFGAQGFGNMSCRAALGCCDVQWGWGRCRCSIRMRNGYFPFPWKAFSPTITCLRNWNALALKNLPFDHCELCRMLENTRKWTVKPLELKTSNRNQYCFWFPTIFILERISVFYSPGKGKWLARWKMEDEKANITLAALVKVGLTWVMTMFRLRKN